MKIFTCHAFDPENGHRLSNRTDGPRHKVCGWMDTPPNDIQFHTIGTSHVWEIPLEDAVQNQRLIRGMDPLDVLKLGIAGGLQLSRP